VHELTPLPALHSPELNGLFATIPPHTLENSDSVIYATGPDYRLIYVNPAWDRFALENGAPELVRDRLTRVSILDCVHVPLRDFYAATFAEALDRDAPVEHTFQCPSAKLARTFRMRILPLKSRGLLIMNSLSTEGPHPPAVERNVSYVDSDGFITMCSHCRRTQQAGSHQWDWVPQFVALQPQHVSHGLCQVCLEYHYLSRKRTAIER
jgi:hypothetical protein